jgi:heavy metal sensor kinase
MIFNSIRTRLTLWYLGILALIVISFAVLTYFLLARNLTQTTDENIAEIARSLEMKLHQDEAERAAEINKANEPDKDPDEVKQTDEIVSTEEAIAEEINDVRFRAYGFLVLNQSEQQIVSTIKDSRLENGLKNLSAEVSFADVSGDKETFRVYHKFFELDGKRFHLFVIGSLVEQTKFLNSLKKIFFIVVPIALLLAGLGGYFLAQRSLAPVVSMSNQAARIGSANLNERLPIKNENDELGSLAKVFNALLARIENAFVQQRRFMADASHELRTPLAIVRSESEVALSKDKRTSDEYRESLAIVHDESKRLTNIVEDLFLLARADSGQFKTHLTTVYLNEILTECVRAVSVLAEQRSINIELSELAEMPLQADESLLHRLFLNLLDNAVKYNRNGGAVFVTAENGDKNYRVTISDTGEGITKEDQTKIFERFYRVDKARSQNNTDTTSGAGLGLSIAAWIAEIHQGSLALKKSDSDGSVFQLELPIQHRLR